MTTENHGLDGLVPAIGIVERSWGRGVRVEIHRSGSFTDLTPKDARWFAAALMQAADEAERQPQP